MYVKFSREQLEQKMKNDMENLFDFLDKKGVLSISKLEKINRKMNNIYIKQMQKRDKASDKVKTIMDCTELALDMCQFLQIEDTRILSRDLIRDEFIHKMLHHKKAQEILHNENVEATGVGYKSYLYQDIDIPKTYGGVEK